ELNTALGAAKAVLAGHARAAEVRALIETVQRNLVALMGEIACAESDAARYAASSFRKVEVADVTRLDEAVAALEARGLRFDGWATPGANALSAALEVARTDCRRAERRLTALPASVRHVRPELRQFINRLADLLWLLAREAEQ
ncbi:MAG: ATP:cob(I)alamin adenosyltransferase, partial [Opitutaceae bacterium]